MDPIISLLNSGITQGAASLYPKTNNNNFNNMDPMTMLLISGLAQTGLGLYQGINANTLKNRFNAQPKATFLDSLGPLQENKRLAEQRMNFGLPDETKNLYKSQFASDSTRALRAASETSGGQMSNAVSRILALNNLNAANTLGNMDAQTRLNAQNQLMGINRDIASVQRAQIQRNMSKEDLVQQQIAGLSQDAFQNVTGAIKGYSSGLMYSKYLDALSKGLIS